MEDHMTDDEYRIEYLTGEQALAVARQQATRELQESESMISYVRFVPELQDFCQCIFQLEAPHGWRLACRMLKPEERMPDEQISDTHIREVALSGNVISAIRLYRGKYNVGLAEGKAGVERLLHEN
jgi:hypothetical protein